MITQNVQKEFDDLKHLIPENIDWDEWALGDDAKVNGFNVKYLLHFHEKIDDGTDRSCCWRFLLDENKNPVCWDYHDVNRFGCSRAQ